MSEFQRPVAVVTGAARRIGKSIALALARNGWNVGVHYGRSREEADAVVAEIETADGRAAAIPADLTRESEVLTVIPRAREALGPVTCLVNNASVFEHDDSRTATRESWDRHLECNLRAPLVLIQDFAAQLPDDAEGNIINLLDERVWNLTPHFLSYTVTKTALWTLTRTLALDLAPRIRVNGIGPGPTLPSARQTDAQFEAQYRATPLRRPTDPEEIAAAVLFLLSAPAVTGQMIALDGGQHLGWAFRRGAAGE
tara:strand:+ start:48 stop:812 length:765 start_codon:yes stop_codon:yes gene_type:complete